MVHEGVETPCVLDLSMPKHKNRRVPTLGFLNEDEPLDFTNTARLEQMDTSPLPPTPTTPNCTSYKKHMLKRYSKL